MKPFDMHLHYNDRHRLPAEVEQELGLTWHANLEEMYAACDVVTLNCPLHPETEHMINDETLKSFKRGAYLVNTARGKLCDRDAIVRAVDDTLPIDGSHPYRRMPSVSGPTALDCRQSPSDIRILLGQSNLSALRAPVGLLFDQIVRADAE